MTPSELRAYAKSQNWSEDFARFDDPTLQGWIDNYWDNSAMKFKSGRQGVTGFWEKPTECPPGQVPWGGSETDKCVPMSEAMAAQGGGGGAAGPGETPGLNTGAEGFRMSDLINSMAWNRVRGISAAGGTKLGVPNLLEQFTKANKTFQRPIFDIGNGQQARMTKGGGLMWGQIDPSWGS